MANSQTLQKFYTTAAQRDFARLFQFRLISFGNIDFSSEHLTYIETASLPGRTINNVQVPYMGLQFNVPGTVTYPGSNAYQVVLRCDQNYDLRSVLEAATFNTFDEYSSTGEYNLPSSDSTLTMALLDKKMEPVRYYTLFGVYVQSLADTAYDIKDGGSVATIQATLAYQFWRSGTGKESGGAPLAPGNDVSKILPNWGGRSPRGSRLRTIR
jgi:hypothetical protein